MGTQLSYVSHEHSRVGELVVVRIGRGVAAKATLSPKPGHDGWCENGSVCRTEISDYVAHAKGNAAYGDKDGVIGTFDVNLRVNLNGRSPRVQTWFDYDSGPRAVFSETRIQVIEDQGGPNPVARWSYVDGKDGNGKFAIGPSDEVGKGRSSTSSRLRIMTSIGLRSLVDSRRIRSNLLSVS